MKEIDLGPVSERCTCPDGDFRHCHGQVRSLEIQNGEMLKLLLQADDLYTGYGLICGGIKGYPEYDGKVHVGEWINKVRAITRQTEKRKDDYWCGICGQAVPVAYPCPHKRVDEGPRVVDAFMACAKDLGNYEICMLAPGHEGPCSRFRA